MVRRLRFSISLPIGAFIALVGVFVLSPGIAHASCGDYVTVGGKLVANVHSADPIHGPSAPMKPCDGPNCSQRPTLPPAAANPGQKMTVEDWGQLILGICQQTPGLDERFIDDEFSKAISQSNSIFHPPRTST